jgi:phage-related minor tail protein
VVSTAMAEIGTGYIKVLYETSGLSEAGSGITSKIMPMMGKYGKLAGAGLAVGVAAGVGKALFDVGSELEKAHNVLRQQTGATGEELAKLNDEAHKVAETVPVSFETAAEGVAAVHQKLKLAGPAATAVTRQMEQLARVTGTDVKDNVDNVTKVLGRWNLGAGQAQRVTNMMFRASQLTGTSFSDLAANTTKSAVVMKQFGFNLTDTTSIFAKLQRSGFNVSKMTLGLNSGLAKMAKAGLDPARAFPKLVQQIKNAHNPTKALGLAVAQFGTRAGSELSQAIRGGVFSTDALTKKIKSGGETVGKASDQTLELGDRWEMFSNQLKVVVAPAAEGIVHLLNTGMALALKDLPKLIKWVGDTIHQVWPTMGHDVSDAAKQIMGAIRQTVHVVQVIWNSWFGHLMKDIILRNLRAIVTAIKSTFRVIGDLFHTIGDLLHGRWGKLWGDIKSLVRDTLVGIVNLIKAVPLVNAVLTLADKAFQAAKRLGRSIKNGVVEGITGVAGAVSDAVTAALRTAGGLLNTGLSKVSSVLNHIPGVHLPSSFNIGLAGGGVINQPTLAWVGETAASRPEIVTPERLLRQIMRDEGGGRGRQALTITNWYEGTGYLSTISGEAVRGAGRLAQQQSRMAR